MTKDVDGRQIAGLVSSNNLDRLIPWIFSNGGDYANQDFTKSQLSAPATVEAIQWYADLLRKEKVQPEISDPGNADGDRDQFLAGRAAMYINGPWQFINMRSKLKDDWDITWVPKGKAGSVAQVAGSGFGVSSSTKYKDQAWQVVKYVTSADQLHPRGALEQPVYERIGKVYASVEAKEPWCVEARPLADLAVLLTASRMSIGDVNRASEADEGALRMLLELHHQFQVIDRDADFSAFPVLVCPDVVRFDPPLAQKVGAYLAQGGKLLLTGQSGLTLAEDAFALDEVGLDHLGPGEYDPDYVLPGEKVAAGLPRMPLVQYGGSYRVRPRPDTQVLSETVAPYFQRNWRHYSSHHQTPYDRPTGLPAATRNGHVVYIAAPLFTAYARQAYPIHRQLLGNYLALLLPRPLIHTNLPTGGQATLLEQPDGRRVAHLLYYVWQRRAPDLDIVEDVVPLYDLELTARTGRRPKRVYLVPDGRELEFSPSPDGDMVSTRVPVVAGHQMVAFEP